MSITVALALPYVAHTDTSSASSATVLAAAAAAAANLFMLF